MAILAKLKNVDRIDNITTVAYYWGYIILLVHHTGVVYMKWKRL